MPDMIDLSQLGNPERKPSAIDTSGKPWPKNVWVQLDSGVTVRCDIKYAGVNPTDGCRLFNVVAEIDWERYHPVILSVEEMPRDAELRFKVPGMSDEDGERVCAAMQFRPDKIVDC